MAVDLKEFFKNHTEPRVKKAFEIAEKAHAGQVDKAGADYIFHPMTLASNCGEDISAVIVALLHDVAEDTNLTLEYLQKNVPLTDEELTALKLLTHDKNIPYPDYIKEIKKNPIAKKVKLCDLEHNLDFSRLCKDHEQLDDFVENLPEKDIQRIRKYTEAKIELISN